MKAFSIICLSIYALFSMLLSLACFFLNSQILVVIALFCLILVLSHAIIALVNGNRRLFKAQKVMSIIGIIITFFSFLPCLQTFYRMLTNYEYGINFLEVGSLALICIYYSSSLCIVALVNSFKSETTSTFKI